MNRPNNRVLQINDIANTAAGIRAALGSRGWQVTQADFPLRVDHPSTPRLLLAQLGFAMRTAWQSRAYDLLHIHYGYFGLLGRLSPKPYVLHCHGTDLRANLNGRLRRPTLAALRGAERILYSTPDLAQYLPEEIKSKARFCPNIIDTNRFIPDPDITLAEGPVSVFISPKVDRYKGFETLIPVIDKLCAAPEVGQISIFNFGNRRSQYSLPEHPKVKLLEPVAYENMPRLIQQHDIVVGQMGLGILSMSEKEAMACEKPLVVRFDFPEVYPSADIPISNVTSEDELYEAIIELAKAPSKRRQMGRDGRKWVIQHHSSAAVANMLDEEARSFLPIHP
ncbi:glycosyltransferase family 4 protein [Cochlodiniinecator piscidefendens]|uniref:glycosyltransferase family 4 protein n=1 Tax=Cochlodiniinecator piscidefendens TaxID=2715756 RepID=UPI00140C5CCF|nr:glycosyltransferase family 4 protein [Cochlodiniinecator piscidefendens]